jgi:Uma2 family endonuclease
MYMETMSSALRVEAVYTTPEEFLAAERVSGIKHEYLAGVVYAMAGGSLNHSLIAMNIGGELRAQLKGGGCRVYNSDALVRIEREGATYLYYSDVAVACVGRSSEYLEHPSVLFEVLSPSTDRNDRGEKRMNYQSSPSLRVYALVEQDRPLVTVYRRDRETWKIELHSELDSILPLPEIGCALAIAEIYREVFPPGAFA